MKPLKLPPRSPNLNAICERWVLSVKSEVISGLIFFSKESLRQTLKEYIIYYHEERNHQGKGNRLLFPLSKGDSKDLDSEIQCRSRLGGLLKYYHREAA